MALQDREATRACMDGFHVCPGACNHRYCSQDCLHKARQWYHSCVCSCQEDRPEQGEKLRQFEHFANLADNEYYIMAATGISMAAVSLIAEIEVGNRDEDDNLDEMLAEQVRSWFGQFEQCLWWQTLEMDATCSSRTSGDREAFEKQVEQQTHEALGLLVQCFSPRLLARLHANSLPHLRREYARLIGAIRM